MLPILLLHGALGAAAQMHPLQGLLANRETHTLDFAGHGNKAGASGNFGIPHFAQEVAEWMDARGMPQADVFGYSMGGYVGLYLARTHPDRIGKVATLGTKFRWSADYALRQRRMLDADAIKAKVPKFAAALAARHGEAHWEGLLDQTAAMMQELGTVPLLNDDAFRKLPHPAMLLVGDRDDTVSVSETTEVRGLLPNAALGVLPATAHPLERVDVELLGCLLGRFFSGR